MIDINYLQEALSSSCYIKFTELADILGVHRNMLHTYMKHHGVERKYTCLSDADLDEPITQFKKKWPEFRVRYLIGFLRQQGVRIQYHWVIRSLHQVDRLSQVLCNWEVKRRQKYYVKRPNTLWHVDGHHKLIRWGVVIHGFIDGFCWTVRSFWENYFPWLITWHPYADHWTASEQQQPFKHNPWFIQACNSRVQYAISCVKGSWWWKHWCCDLHDYREGTTPSFIYLGSVSPYSHCSICW